MVQRLASVVAICLGCGLLVACHGVAEVAPGMPGSMGARPLGIADTNLYVANGGGKFGSGSLNIYGLERGKLLESITNGINRPSAVGYDAPANLIVVANTEPTKGSGSGSVALYSPGGNKPFGVLKGTADPVSLAFDSTGKIYVADFKGGVNIYKPDDPLPILVIPGGQGSDYYGVNAPRAVTVDDNGTVYVANGPVSVGSSDNVFAIAAFPPGMTQSSWIVDAAQPRALLASNGLLYSAEAYPKTDKRNPDGWVRVYKLGTSYPQLLLTITQAIRTPDALALDPYGNLYVANLNGQSVSVYGPGSSVPGWVITNGIHFPKALALGPQANLYVSNLYENTVTAYRYRSVDPFLTVKQSIQAPVSLTLNGSF